MNIEELKELYMNKNENLDSKTREWSEIVFLMLIEIVIFLPSLLLILCMN